MFLDLTSFMHLWFAEMVSLCRNNATINAYAKTQNRVKHRVDTQTHDPTQPGQNLRPGEWPVTQFHPWLSHHRLHRQLTGEMGDRPPRYASTSVSVSTTTDVLVTASTTIITTITMDGILEVFI